MEGLQLWQDIKDLGTW